MTCKEDKVTVASEEHRSLRRVRRRHLLRRDPAAPTSIRNSTHFPILSRPVSSDPRRWVLQSSSRRGLRRIPRQISTQKSHNHVFCHYL
nr:hypothetical protein CFP56_63622 [Quercus suber]